MDTKLKVRQNDQTPYGLFLMILAGMSVVLGFMLWSNLTQTINERSNTATIYARIVEQSLTRTLESIENSLTSLALDIENRPVHMLDLQAIEDQFNRIIGFAPHIRQIILLHDNKVLYDSRRAKSQNIDLSQLDFDHQKQSLLISSLEIGSKINSRFLPLEGQDQSQSSRHALIPIKMDVETGTLDKKYTFLVALNDQYVRDIFEKIENKFVDGYRLFLFDGSVLVSDQTGPVGPDLQAFLAKLLNSNRLDARFHSSGTFLNKKEQAIQISSKYPFILSINIDHKNSFIVWRNENKWLIISTFLSLLTIIGALVILYQDFKKVQRLNKEIRILFNAIRQSPVSILITDAQGRIEHANPAFEKTYGYSFEEVYDKTPSILKNDKTSDKTYQELWYNLNHGLPWQGEFINKTKDGIDVPTQSAISPVIDEDGNVTHHIGVLTDITQQKKLQDEAFFASRKAELASQAKSNFLATMSHELRTPMTGIRGIIELLHQSTTEAEKKALLKDLETSSSALMTLLNDILDLSKIEAGKLNIELLPCHPAKIVKNICDLFAESAREKNLKLSHNLMPDDRTWIVSDELRLRQILSNFVSNAIKFTPQGHVKVGLHYQNLGENNVLMQFVVEDSGIGMNEAQSKSIFSPFQQADSATTRKFGGTGLGLSICKQLSEKLGGEIELESTPDQGTTFVVSIPVELAQAQTESVASAQKLKPLNILLVEDNPINRKVMEAMLVNKAHTVTTAEHGRDATEKSCAEKFDVILMDMQMPIMDGMDATRYIRNHCPQNKSTPIYAFTADAIRDHHKKYIEAGVNGVVTKPVKMNKLESLFISLS